MKSTLIIILLFVSSPLIGASQNIPATAALLGQSPTSLTADQQQQTIALFFSIFPSATTTYTNFTSLDSLTTLIFEKTLGLTGSTLSAIKQFYAYLKYEAVQEYLEKTPPPTPSSLGITSPVTFPTNIVDTLTYINQKIAAAKKTNDPLLPTWENALTSLQSTITTIINNTIAPNAVTACLQTNSWQNHLKTFIANSFIYEKQLLGTIHQDEIQIFTFLPQFETAYYTDSYQQIRVNDQYVRTLLALTDLLRTRALAQCTDWSTITDQGQLCDTITTFMQGDFYTFAQTFSTVMTSKTTTPVKNPVINSATSPQSINTGYAQFFTLTTGTVSAPTLQATQNMQAIFSITNNVPSLTALGSFLLSEGTITNSTGQSYPGLQTNANFAKLFTEKSDGSGYIPSDLYLELLSFTGIQLINNFITPLFNSANLAATMNDLYTMRTNNPSVNFEQFPNVIFYEPEDQLFLETINSLSSQVFTSPTGQSATPSDWFDSFCDAFTSLGNSLKSDIIQVGNDFWQATKSVGDMAVSLAYATEDIGVGFYYETGIACAVTGISYSEATTRGANYLNDVGVQIDNIGQDCQNVVNDMADVCQQVANGVGSIIGQCLAALIDDPALGRDIEGAISSFAAIFIDYTRDTFNMFIEAGFEVVKLTVEGALVIATSYAQVYAMATGNTMNNTFMYFIRDIAASILNVVSVCIKLIGDVLINIMELIAYIVSTIVDLIADIGGVCAGIGTAMTGGGFNSGWNSVHKEINQHRALIASVTILTIMTLITVADIAVTVLTVGTAGPIALSLTMGLMGTAMMAMSTIGANQQDMDAMAQQQNQEAILADFQIYTAQSPAAQKAVATQILNEIKIRLAEQIDTINRGTVYYENYLNNSLNVLRYNQGYQLGVFYNQILTTDNQNYPGQTMLPADAGYSYGIQTNHFDLNPSQGFRVYNKGRGTFAQEIATVPAPLTPPAILAQTASEGTVDPSQTTASHFISQKDLCNIPGSSVGQQKIVIRWRVIYESGSDFYIGIYYNQNYLDPTFLTALNAQFELACQSINSSPQQFSSMWGALNTFNGYLYNFDFNAKAFICYQNSTTNNQPALGVYEHSSQQFIVGNQQPTKTANWFQDGTWYIMTLTISGNEATATFTPEGSTSPVWQTQATVTPYTTANLIPYQNLGRAIGYQPTTPYAGSFGVITSGAAVEYQIISPTPSITETTQRKTSNTTLQNSFKTANVTAKEQTREQQWAQQQAQTQNPTFGSLKLTLCPYQGVNIYSVNSGTIPLTNNNLDYLVTLQNPPTASATPGIGNSLMGATMGQALNTTTQTLVSLVSGSSYTAKGTGSLVYPDALTAYTAQQSSFPQALTTAIQNSQQNYHAQQSGTVSFQNASVKGTGNTVPVYSCPSLNTGLPGTDYLIFVSLVNGQPGSAQSINPPASSNTINTAISLVTGVTYNLVTASNNQPITQLPQTGLTSITLSATTMTYPNIYSAYQTALTGTTGTAIQNQTTVYSNYQKQISQQQQAIVNTTKNTTNALQQQPVPKTDPLVPSQSSLQQTLFNSLSFGGFTG